METLVRQAIGAAVRRDFDGLLALDIDPGFEYASLFAQAEGETWRGVDGIRRWAAEVDATWEDFHVEVEEVEELDADLAVVCARLTGRGRGSGVPLDSRLGQVWVREDGLLRRVIAYPSLAEAHAAARALRAPRSEG
jgi:ketosteroid isomerase-like protein